MNLKSHTLEIIDRRILLTKGLAGAAGVVTFVILTFLGAYLSVSLPFTPVPITLQTFFVLLSGAILGRKLGGISQAGYVILGSLGLPIFAGATGGILCLAGPTGGYLIGFIIASYLIGWIINIREKLTFGWVAMVMAVGSVVIYLFGMSWLAIIMGITPSKAFIIGVLPFIPGDIFKLIIGALIFYKFQARLTGIFMQ